MLTPRGEFEDRSGVTQSVASCLLVFSTVFILLRIHARCFIIKNFGLDDALACVAYVGPLFLKKHVDIVADWLTMSARFF
jgi:hypothetical protein